MRCPGLPVLARASVAFALSCSSADGTSTVADAASDGAPRRTLEGGAPSGGDAARPPDDAGAASVIGLADEWVAGWYGTAYRGTNLYSHVDTAGAPGGYYTQWRGDPGVTLFANVTDCSSFSDVLMTRVHGWVPSTTGPRPLAADYYWAIRGGGRFTQIASVTDLEVGDVVALLYGTTDSSGDSGHVAWVDSLPQPYSDGPVEPGLDQYSVTIIDSADGFHFAPTGNAANQDDRYLGNLADGGPCTSDAECVADYGPSAVCDTWQLASATACAFTGVGRGQLRLYADSTGALAGYTWGTSDGSTFYPRPTPLPRAGEAFTGRDVVAGRYSGP